MSKTLRMGVSAFLGFALVLAAGTSDADDTIPVTRPALPCYATADDAARAALVLVMPRSDRVEYGGVVLEIAGEFCHTTPVEGGPVSVNYRVRAPKGARLAALYHTHPARAYEYHAVRFSDHDKAQAHTLGVPSYLGIARSGQIKVYDPSTAPKQALR